MNSCYIFIIYKVNQTRTMQEAHISCSDKEPFGRAACRDSLMKTITACNKITDAGVCRDHSGSTRMLFQEATHQQTTGFMTLVL